MESPRAPTVIPTAVLRPAAARRFARAARTACVAAALTSIGPAAGRIALPGPDTMDHVVTVLDEVRAGSVDGLDYLTIAIGTAAVGPLRCRGKVLRVDAANAAAPGRLAAMEQVALTAMLGAETVLVTVPLSPEACRDGRPTFVRLDLLPASP